MAAFPPNYAEIILGINQPKRRFYHHKRGETKPFEKFLESCETFCNFPATGKKKRNEKDGREKEIAQNSEIRIQYRLEACLHLRQKSQDERVRRMATLKAISTRLKSVKNIQKITKSMKMVSAAKFSRAERDLKQARPLGDGMKIFYEKAEIGKEKDRVQTEEEKKTIYVAVTSDRGLCGAVHTSVAKAVRKTFVQSRENVRIVCIGEKARSLLSRYIGESFLCVCQEVGRLPPNFADASLIANEILNSGFEFESAKIIYNRYRSVVSYSTETMEIFSVNRILQSPKINMYDEVDEETLLPFVEFSLAAFLYFAMKEGACSEQSSRMTAMDSASKNAGDMINKLTLTFNRTRQAVITRELIEIISGASAL